MYRLSVIIPVYNAAEYLVECVESLYRQGLREEEFEVILVDDGSKDNSKDIADDLSQKHCNIKVCSQKNAGQATARNNALEIASGKYIAFLDSDDYLEDDCYNNILTLAENKGLDMCEYQMFEHHSDGSVVRALVQPFTPEKIYSGVEALTGNAIMASVCTVIYSKDFLTEHNLRFATGIFHEDSEFNLRAYAYAEKILFTDICGYHYRWNPTSTDRSKNIVKSQKRVMSDFIIAKNLYDFANNSVVGSVLQEHYKKRVNSLVASTVLSLRTMDKDIVTKEFLNECFTYLRSNRLFPIKGKSLTGKMTIMSKLLNVLFDITKIARD